MYGGMGELLPPEPSIGYATDCIKWWERINLLIYVHKFKIRLFERSDVQTKYCVSNEMLEQVTVYVYFGFMFFINGEKMHVNLSAAAKLVVCNTFGQVYKYTALLSFLI